MLAEPVGPAVDMNGLVHLVSRGSGWVQKFEADGTPLLAFQDMAVRTATSMALDAGGAVYVADARAGRIRIYFPDGDFLRWFRVAPQDKGGAFAFSIAGDGTIFVPDPAGGRVQAFSARGRLVRTWKLPPAATGEAAKPIAAAAASDEFVYVGDAQTGRILKYTARGAESGIWEPPPDALTPLRGVTVSSKHVFVLRGERPQLEVWTFEGQRILTNSLEGRLENAPAGAIHMAVNRNEELFLLDSATPQVLRFRIRIPAF
jgi:hypothetical protein